MSALRASIVTASVWGALRQIVAKSFNLIQLFVLARLLEPEDFGLFAVAALVYAFVEAMTYLGFGHALIHKKNIEREHLDTLFVINIVRGIILLLLVALVAYPVSLLVGEPRAIPYILAIGIMSFITGLHNPAVIIFQKELNLKSDLVYQLSGAGFALVVSLLIAWVHPSAWALIGGLLAQTSAQLVVSYWLHPFRPAFRYTSKHFSDMANFGKWLMASQALKYFANNIPAWSIGSMLGLPALGLYQVAGRLSQAIGNEFAALIGTIAFPAFSKLNGDLSKMAGAYLASQRLIVSVSFLIFGLLIAVSDRAVDVLLGPKWGNASVVLMLLSVHGAIQSIGAQVEVLKALGRTKVIAAMTFYRFIMVSILVYPVSTIWGLEGAIWAVILPAMIILPFSIVIVMKSIGIKLSSLLRILLPPLGALAMMTGAVQIMDPFISVGISGFILILFAGSVIYIAVLLLLDRWCDTAIYNEFESLWRHVILKTKRSS